MRGPPVSAQNTRHPGQLRAQPRKGANHRQQAPALHQVRCRFQRHDLSRGGVRKAQQGRLARMHSRPARCQTATIERQATSQQLGPIAVVFGDVADRELQVQTRLAGQRDQRIDPRTHSRRKGERKNCTFTATSAGIIYCHPCPTS